MTMVGIPLGSVSHLQPKRLEDVGIVVTEPHGESLYERIRALADYPRKRIYLTAFSFADLGLEPYCQTKDIFEAATSTEGQGAETVPYSTALQIQVEHPTLFHPGLWASVCGKKLPFRKCLVGVKPITGANGQQYVIELSEGSFRFRRASPYDEWPDEVFWVFTTWD